MEVEGGEMVVPINSSYGVEHGHIINHESSQHNHIIPPLTVEPFTNGTTKEESVVVAYNNNNNNNNSNRMVVRYRECMKNHAASIGGNARDGCGEFMPLSHEESLTCSVCNCHRNFHRKEVEGLGDYKLYHSSPSHLRNVFFQKGSLGTESFAPSRAAAAPMIVSYNMGLGSLQSESDDQEDGHGYGHGFVSRHPCPQAHHQIVKKRFRTKFTQEQKEKMFSFAEKVGWKIQKQEESVVQQFCQELGIKRRVLKVWMHNNKHNLAKNINSIPTNPPNQDIQIHQL